jgi:hypothetical protein
MPRHYRHASVAKSSDLKPYIFGLNFITEELPFLAEESPEQPSYGAKEVIAWSPTPPGARKLVEIQYPGYEITPKDIASGEELANENILQLNVPTATNGPPVDQREVIPAWQQIVEAEETRRDVPLPPSLRQRMFEIYGETSIEDYQKTQPQFVKPTISAEDTRERALPTDEGEQKRELLRKFKYMFDDVGDSRFRTYPNATLEALQATWDDLDGDNAFYVAAGTDYVPPKIEKPFKFTSTPTDRSSMGWPFTGDIYQGEIDPWVVKVKELQRKLTDAHKKAENQTGDGFLQPFVIEDIVREVYGADIPDEVRQSLEELGIDDYDAYYETRPVIRAATEAELATGSYKDDPVVEFPKPFEILEWDVPSEAVLKAEHQRKEDFDARFVSEDPAKDGGVEVVDKDGEVGKDVTVVVGDGGVETDSKITGESRLITVLENGEKVYYYYNADENTLVRLADVTSASIASTAIANEITKKETGTMAEYPYGSIPTIEEAFGPRAGYEAGLGLYGQRTFNPFQRAQLGRFPGYQSLFDVQTRLGLLGQKDPTGPYGGYKITQPYLGQYVQPPQATAADVAGVDLGREQYYGRARDIFRTTAGLTPEQRGQIGVSYDPASTTLPNILRAALRGGGQLSRSGIDFLLSRLGQDYTTFAETEAGAGGAGDFLGALIDKYDLRGLTGIPV